MRPRERTNVERSRALDLLREGATVRDVMRALDLPDGTIRRWAQWAGVEPRRLRERRTVAPDARVIRRTLGCGHTRVSRGSVCGSCRIDVVRGRAVLA